ncbi:MAG: cyanophycinase [Acidobacteriota bacterium]
MTGRFQIALTLAMTLAPWLGPATLQGQSVGPPNGSLVAIGGGQISPEIYRKFIELAGGRDAPIVYIPSAVGLPEYGPDFAGWALAGFQAAGATNTRLLHAKDRAEADSEEFVEVIRRAAGVFFGGGRQWRLVDLYMGTESEAALRGVLERGGVIGGSSAGATILGSFLARGDTRGNMIMMGDHQEGLGYLKDVAIDQHLLRRNRHFDLLEIVEAHPEVLGIGLDEGAAIVVLRDRFEVMGGYVAIYDGRRSTAARGRSDKGFYFLAPGDQFELAGRVATRSSEGPQEFWLPQLEVEVEVEPALLRRWVGTYKAGERQLEIAIENGQLHLESVRRARRPLEATSESTFLDAANGQRLSFLQRDEGATLLRLGRGDGMEVLTRVDSP